METIKANPTAKVTLTNEFSKLIDGVDYSWDNDKKELVIEKKGFIGEHSDIILSDEGDSIAIKRVWIKGKEINAVNLWCRKSKKSLATMLDDNIEFTREESTVNVIDKTYDDGIVQITIKEFHNGEEVVPTIDRIAVAITEKVDKEKIEHEAFLANNLDEAVKEAYLNLDTDEKRKEFRANYSRMKISEGVASTVTMEENKIIKAIDIDTDTAIAIMKAGSEDHSINTTNTQENFKKLRDKLKKQVTNDFIVKRGRVVNGELDRLLTMKEVQEIDEEVSRLIETDKRLQVSADMSKINGVYDAINNRNLDSQIAYEVKKEAFCNGYGYTPDSFDAYMNEIFRLQDEKLSAGGYAKPVSTSTGDGFEEATTIQNMLDNSDVEAKARVKLVQVEGWDELEYKDRPILYRSELLLKVIEQDKREMNPEMLEKLRQEDPNSMRLYDIMNDTIYSIDRWRKVRKKRKGEQGLVTHKRSVANKSDVEKFMEARKENHKKKKESGEITDKISVDLEINKDLIGKVEPNIKSVDEAYNDLIGDDIETVNVENIGDEKDDVQGNFGRRESEQDGTRTAGREPAAVHRETTRDGEDVTPLQGDNDTRGNESGGAISIEGRDNESTPSSDNDIDRARSGNDVQDEVIIDDDDDITHIEVVVNDRPDTIGNSGSVDSEDEHGERPSEVQRDINDEESESQKEVTDVILEEDRVSEESITTLGRRVYSEDTKSISNIEIEEVTTNDRENNRYNTTNNNDNTSSDGADTDTGSSDELHKRGTVHIQSEEIREDSHNEQRSESSSDRTSIRTGDIMAEKIEVKMLNITSDGNIILTNGNVVTPEEFKAMKDEGNLTVDAMLASDEVEEAEVVPNRVRITDDNLDNMFSLIISKKATWQQQDDFAVVNIKGDDVEYVYEPVSKFINKYTDFAIGNIVSETPVTTAKVKGIEEIKENIDELKNKPSRKKIKDVLDEYNKAKSEKHESLIDTNEVQVVEVIDVTDMVDIEELEADDDKFKEYDRPLEVKSKRITDKFFIDRQHVSGNEIDEMFSVYQTEKDLSILRNAHDFNRVKDYWNSDVYGRELYLPNSNYVVTVKRLKDRNRLTDMFTFLEGVRDMSAAEDIARSEVMTIVYNQLDFPFETRPTEVEFLKNLHQTDVTILMIMFALINLPEDSEGRVIIPEISRFACPKCGRHAFLKNDISIDAKAEFYAMYPKSLWIENYSKYKKAYYKTIQKAYRASKVGARFGITDNSLEGDVRAEIIISRPTVYKQQAVEASRLEVCYDIRLEELTRILSKATEANNVPDEVLKCISYMSDRSFSEVKHRIMMLDDAGLDRDIEDVPESSREQFKKFQEEARIIQFVTEEVNRVNERLAPTFNSCQYIDSIVIIDTTIEKPIKIVDHTDLYEMIDVIPYLSDAAVNAMNKTIEDLKNGYNGISTNITFTPEEFKGKFRWDDIWQVINGKILSEKDFLQRIQDEGGYSDKDMKEVAEYRKTYKENLDAGKCVCGNDEPWILNWTDLLFFSTAKILGKTRKEESVKSFLL